MKNKNGKKYVLQHGAKHDKLDLVASAEKKMNVLWKLNRIMSNVNVNNNWQQSSVRRNEHNKLLLESLILAQDERWRRA
jgi:hypothetical protein